MFLLIFEWALQVQRYCAACDYDLPPFQPENLSRLLMISKTLIYRCFVVFENYCSTVARSGRLQMRLAFAPRR